jgi:hypothetical protein
MILTDKKEELTEKELEEKIDREVEEDVKIRANEASDKKNKKKADRKEALSLLDNLPELKEMLKNRTFITNLSYALINKTRKMESLPILRTALLIELLKEQARLNDMLEEFMSDKTRTEEVPNDVSKRLVRKRGA